MLVRLGVCAVLLLPLPIAFVESLQRDPPLTAVPPLGVRVVPEALPHARRAAPVVRRVGPARRALRHPDARIVLVSYVAPRRHVAAPVTVRHSSPAQRKPARTPAPAKRAPKPHHPAPPPRPAPSPPRAPPAPPAQAPGPTPAAAPAPLAPPPVTPPLMTPPPMAPPPALQAPPAGAAPTLLAARPGHGYGDPNHVHTGPPSRR